MDINNFSASKLVPVALAVLVIAGGLFIYRERAGEKGFFSGPVSPNENDILSSSGAELTAESLEKEKHDISGYVTGVGRGSFLVEAEIADISAINEKNFSSDNLFPKIKKVFEVISDKNTEVESMGGGEISLSDIKTGDHVAVISKEGIYERDKLSALKIIISAF